MRRVVYLDGQKEDPCVEHIAFPTGEKHIRIFDLQPVDEVILVYNDPSGDIMKLGMAVDICKRVGVNNITVVMPFVPYARQDQVYIEGDPLSIRVFTNFLNYLRVDRVIITDPHSNVTSSLIDNVTVIPQHLVAASSVMRLNEHINEPIALVAPDIGAAKKIKTLQAYLKKEHKVLFPVIQCDKTRDPETGKITGFKVLDGNPKGCHCLMVDDICDGGGTYLGLGEVLMEQGADAMSLFVTHGIFSKGIKTLFSKFEFIYASDSFPRQIGVIEIKTGALNNAQ